MSDIQEEAYSELCEENGRLKVEIERLKDAIIEKDTLLVRAADVLEEEFGDSKFGEADLSDRSPWNLIIELRKAAE
jgi:hypothetical protein